ncbi:MAG TPA: amylo-alpha-1,6-glucosidase [Bryobacteraceae bacterium]|nr:amylo-alpha-1,6-glucosidase [Bryobacteraceae bacterium]
MKSNKIRFDQNVCTNLSRALKLEWLETNGLGGFASSTITGLNTRRYHGLLTAATRPPVGRVLMLSKLEESLVIGDHKYDLSANQYPGVVHPQGHNFMVEFRLDPFPVFVYRAGGVEIEKRVFMLHGENTTVVEYELRPLDGRLPVDSALEVRPLIAFRDYHSTTHRNNGLDPDVKTAGAVASIAPYHDLPPLFFSHDGELQRTGDWYLNFEYAVERERGLDFQEDLFNPLLLRFGMTGKRTATLIASTGPHDPGAAPSMRAGEIARRRAIVDASPSSEPLVQALVAAADQYIVERGDLKTIVAGYHWFTDWGRDTMIALPGLTLVTGRFEVAKQILNAFAASIDQGMLPNRFPDAGETPEFNTVDATLWFFEAIRAYLQYTGDHAFVRDTLYPKLKDIINWHLSGTRYHIGVAPDCLLQCGEPGVQLTWMDSKIGDFVVTPRSGKPVEIQALWYNALCIMQDFAKEFADGHLAVFFEEFAARTRDSFNAEFWNDEGGYLYDTVDGEVHDGSIRPNQIIAVSLTHSMLSMDRARQVVEVVERELLTPLGLRSLSPHHPCYRRRYEGGVRERDTAYHQGTVWPWLMGPFLTAYMRVKERMPEALRQAKEWLDGFGSHLSMAGLGHISEIADAEDGHQPRGCIAQAWSVGELLRAAVENVYEIKNDSVRGTSNAVREPVLD